MRYVSFVAALLLILLPGAVRASPAAPADAVATPNRGESSTAPTDARPNAHAIFLVPDGQRPKVFCPQCPKADIIFIPSVAGEAPAVMSRSQPRRLEIDEAVLRLSPQYGLDPRLITAIIAAESAFKADAVSPKGAMGLMQLMPDTAMRFRVSDSFDVLQNLMGGMSYLQWLLRRYNGDVDLTLAAYNAGERTVDENRIPQSTSDYVASIRRSYPSRQLVNRAVALSSMKDVAAIREVELRPDAAIQAAPSLEELEALPAR